MEDKEKLITKIWSQLDECQKEKKGNPYETHSELFCKNCKKNSGELIDNCIICEICGLIIGENLEKLNSNCGGGSGGSGGECCNFNKILTNEQKKKYNLYLFVKENCEKLSIPYVSLICEIMSILFSLSTSKRSKVKEGIFVVCTYFSLKMHGIERSLNDLGKSLSLESKYISKAEKLLSEVISDKTIFSRYPIFKDILKIMNEKNNNLNELYKHSPKLINTFSLENEEFDKICQLISKCEELSILTDSSPKSIVVGCVYFYISNKFKDLKKGDIANIISNIFSCSPGTIKRIAKEIEKRI